MKTKSKPRLSMKMLWKLSHKWIMSPSDDEHLTPAQLITNFLEFVEQEIKAPIKTHY